MKIPLALRRGTKLPLRRFGGLLLLTTMLRRSPASRTPAGGRAGRRAAALHLVENSRGCPLRVLRRVFSRQRNSAAGHVWAKLNPGAATPASGLLDPGTAKAGHADVLLPSAADSRWSAPDALLNAVEVQLPTYQKDCIRPDQDNPRQGGCAACRVGADARLREGLAGRAGPRRHHVLHDPTRTASCISTTRISTCSPLPPRSAPADGATSPTSSATKPTRKS